MSRRRGVGPSACALFALVSTACAERGGPADVGTGAADTCLYSDHSIAELEAIAGAIGRPIPCAMVFNNAAPTWDDLERPWFLGHPDPDLDWARWKRAEPGRRLVISQALVPDDAAPDWRARGAEGTFDAHARRLAERLVAAGLGDSVIRLAHEANGGWTRDGLGPDPTQFEEWRLAWRSFAISMRSVPGAEFRFDWTVNPGVRPIAFEDYYPGDDVVDVVGVDIYDFWETARLGPPPDDPDARWSMRFAEPLGAGELIAFAERHGKPLSIPEWGLSRPGPQGGLGDNPSFVEAIAALVREHDVAYHAYFAKSPDHLVVESPRSFAAYRDAFGAATVTTVPSVPSVG